MFYMHPFFLPQLRTNSSQKSREKKSSMSLDNIRISLFYLLQNRSELRSPKLWKRVIMNNIKCRHDKDFIAILLIALERFLTNRKSDIEDFSAFFTDKIFTKLLCYRFQASFMWWKVGKNLNHFHLFHPLLIILNLRPKITTIVGFNSKSISNFNS